MSAIRTAHTVPTGHTSIAHVPHNTTYFLFGRDTKLLVELALLLHRRGWVICHEGAMHNALLRLPRAFINAPETLAGLDDVMAILLRQGAKGLVLNVGESPYGEVEKVRHALLADLGPHGQHPFGVKWPQPESMANDMQGKLLTRLRPFG